MSLFQKATRQKAKLKIALTGPAGSGKTYSALSIAKGIGKKIALVDTENGSASLYADRFEFDTACMTPPYLTMKYMKAIDQSVDAGYEVLILDSISHAWAAEGGILRRKDALDAGGKGNSYTNWNRFTPEHEQFIAKILHAPIHIIATMRSKQAHILIDHGGKQVPKKVGMAPVQRDGVDYEFTVVFDLGMNHQCEASKDRTGMFDGHVFQPDHELGIKLIEWINSGKDPVPDPPKPSEKKKEENKEKAAEKKPESTRATKKTRHPADFQMRYGKNRGMWTSSFTKETLDEIDAKLKKLSAKGNTSKNCQEDLLSLDRYLMEVFPEKNEPIQNRLPEGEESKRPVGQEVRQQGGADNGPNPPSHGESQGDPDPGLPGSDPFNSGPSTLRP